MDRRSSGPGPCLHTMGPGPTQTRRHLQAAPSPLHPFAAAACLAPFGIGLPCVHQGGVYRGLRRPSASHAHQAINARPRVGIAGEAHMHRGCPQHGAASRWRHVVPLLLLAALAAGLSSTSAPPPALGSPLAGAEDVSSLIHVGRYAEAEAAARSLLATAERTWGPHALGTAGAIDLLVESLYETEKRTAPETMELASRALSIREASATGDDQALGRSLYNLGAVVYAHYDFAQARAIIERSLTVREHALGPDHPDVAQSTWLLGEILLDLDEWEKARQCIERSLTMREQALGPDHPDVAQSLDSMAKINRIAGDLATARELSARALAIREALGPDHPLVGKSLHNLGRICQIQGEYARARELHERALRIQLATVGPTHPCVAYSLIALATIDHFGLGDYVAARANYQQAFTILDGRVEAQQIQFTTLTSNYAMLLAESGDVAEAGRRHEEVLSKRRAALGDNHSLVADGHCRLGYFHLCEGDTAAARVHFVQAAAICEETLAPDDSNWIDCLRGLAMLDWASGNLAEAERLSARCLQIARRTYEPTQAVFLSLLPLQAGIRLCRGDDAGASRLYQEALAVAGRLPGVNAPQVAEIRQGLAIALAHGHEPEAALDMALAAGEVAREHVVLTARTLPERQALDSLSQLRGSMDLVLSLLAADPEPTAAEKRRVWDALVRTRGLVLDEMSSRNAVLRDETDPEVKRLAEDFRAARQQLANLIVRGAAGASAEQYERLYREARRASEEAEEALAARSLEFRRTRARESVDLAAVLSHVPPGATLVAFTRFNRHDTSPGGETPTPWQARTAAYGVFTAHGGEDDPDWLCLGDADEIDGLVAAWRAQLVAASAPWAGDAAAEETCRQAGAALRARVWDQLTPYLVGVSRVFIVPDGTFCRVHLDALPAGDSGYLVETGLVTHILSAEKDLVPEGESIPAGSGLLAVGGVDFEQSAPAGELLAVLDGPRRDEHFRGPRPACKAFASIVFEPLPATEQEIDDAIVIWSRYDEDSPVVRLSGTEASEEALKRLAPGRAILHLATHGIFLDGSCPSAARGRRGLGGIAAIEVAGAGTSPAENPLQLSGLALAGANQRASAAPGADDGILTAEEIATLDLAEVEWVVLSACDTGLGQIRTGEGILGLRRAFQTAGARTLIMSLWAVEDEATRQWMHALYEGRFTRSFDSAASAHHAALTTLKARRERGESTHPFFWAGFVASGDWR